MPFDVTVVVSVDHSAPSLLTRIEALPVAEVPESPPTTNEPSACILTLYSHSVPAGDV